MIAICFVLSSDNKVARLCLPRTLLNLELIIVDKVYNKNLDCNLRIKTIKDIESFENIYGGHEQLKA